MEGSGGNHVCRPDWEFERSSDLPSRTVGDCVYKREWDWETISSTPGKIEDRTTAASQSESGATNRGKKNFRTLIDAQKGEKVFAFDEGRFGLKIWFRRRWCPKGVRPPWIIDDRYEWI